MLIIVAAFRTQKFYYDMTILTMKGSYGMVWVSIYSVNYNNTVQMSEDFHQKKKMTEDYMHS